MTARFSRIEINQSSGLVAVLFGCNSNLRMTLVCSPVGSNSNVSSKPVAKRDSGGENPPIRSRMPPVRLPLDDLLHVDRPVRVLDPDAGADDLGRPGLELRRLDPRQRAIPLEAGPEVEVEDLPAISSGGMASVSSHEKVIDFMARGSWAFRGSGRRSQHPARQPADRRPEPLVPRPPVGLREDAADPQSGRPRRRPQEGRDILVVAEPHRPVTERNAPGRPS